MQKKNYSIEDQTLQYLNSFPLQLNPIISINNYTFGPQILQKYSNTHPYYREFKASDPNALVKIAILSIIEFLYSICEYPEDFYNGLSQFTNLTCMA